MVVQQCPWAMQVVLKVHCGLRVVDEGQLSRRKVHESDEEGSEQSPAVVRIMQETSPWKVPEIILKREGLLCF